MRKIPVSELIIGPNGQIYHLNLRPEDIATRIILVGDPERVHLFRPYFEKIEVAQQKREFCTLTGVCQGKRLSVISTGIGTDNIDIVLNELDALANINLSTRTPSPSPRSLQLLRLGTCGALSASIPPGSLIHSRYALGADGLMHYYESAPLKDFQQAIDAFHQQYCPNLHFYPAQADSALEELLVRAYPEIVAGITFTANGFYAPQGRNLHRLPLSHPRLIDYLDEFEYRNTKVLNMEMESAGILGLGQALGHRTGCICVALANRKTGAFATDPHALVLDLIEKGIEIMLKWE